MREPFVSQYEYAPEGDRSAEHAALVKRMVASIERVIVGKSDVIELALVAMLSEGHLLIEDVPGTGKTMLARALAASLALHFKRIQFTPDLLPSDVTGLTVYHQKTEEFVFRPGPVFTNILLADEINRATPRTQAALLECMGEAQVTVDGKTYALPKTFFVIATENPIESQGTFPLPEAQLDRFLMRINVGYPGRAHESAILFMQQHEHPIQTVTPVVGEAEIAALRAAVKDIYVEQAVGDYIVDIVGATRGHPSLIAGASPRGSLALMRASQAAALARGESFVRPAIVKRMAPHVLGHRVMLHPQVRISGASPERVISEILGRVPVPTSLREAAPPVRRPPVR
jgi:MoxR-like ATPase